MYYVYDLFTCIVLYNVYIYIYIYIYKTNLRSDVKLSKIFQRKPNQTVFVFLS